MKQERLIALLVLSVATLAGCTSWQAHSKRPADRKGFGRFVQVNEPAASIDLFTASGRPGTAVLFRDARRQSSSFSLVMTPSGEVSQLEGATFEPDARPFDPIDLIEDTDIKVYYHACRDGKLVRIGIETRKSERNEAYGVFFPCDGDPFSFRFW